ncbi:hypothetical protein Leryth_024053, partial [Lithospermum erythrorhizon]
MLSLTTISLGNFNHTLFRPSFDSSKVTEVKATSIASLENSRHHFLNQGGGSRRETRFRMNCIS